MKIDNPYYDMHKCKDTEYYISFKKKDWDFEVGKVKINNCDEIDELRIRSLGRGDIINIINLLLEHLEKRANINMQYVTQILTKEVR